MNNNPTRDYSIPHMMNMSYDKAYQQNTVSIVGLNATTNTLERVVVEGTTELLIDEASSTVTYIGESPANTATSAASWKIFKVDTTSNPSSIKYADGSTAFDKVWDNRVSYSY